MRKSPRIARWLACMAWLAAGHALGQQVQLPAPASLATEPSAAVPTLDKVQALRPDEETLDLDRFENPITVDPNRFSKAYDTGITPEQMAIKHGGYINYGINQGLLKTWQGAKKITHMRPYEQPALARPPPLSQEQMRRAVKASAPAE